MEVQCSGYRACLDLIIAILVHINLAYMQTIFQTCTLKLSKKGVGLTSEGWFGDIKELTHNSVVVGRSGE